MNFFPQKLAALSTKFGQNSDLGYGLTDFSHKLSLCLFCLVALFNTFIPGGNTQFWVLGSRSQLSNYFCEGI